MPGKLHALPLFPLGLVLLPGEALPLHIFEERYKTMINECIETGSEFGVVWESDDGVQDIGCTARVMELVERTDDGRMNILTEGGRVFRLLRRIEDLPYPAGDAELLDEDIDQPPSDLVDAIHQRYGDLVERATDERPPAADLAELDAYAMAGTIAFGPEAKQGLLELRSETSRLQTFGEMLENAIRRLEFMESAGERAQVNGKVNLWD
ncbi:MAG: hypothetical protein QOG62_442 [Thermoleophilaceae bacterium]|jgi:Lon protease-like protein|nr:hypothetical protein [Thermoleophilaceae bacterium]